MLFYNADAFISLVGEDYKRADYENILETARLLSQNDPGVVEIMEYALNDPKGYFADLSDRDDESGWVSSDKFDSLYDALFFVMLFELDEHGYYTSVRWKCWLEAYLSWLSKLKNYDMIADAVQIADDYLCDGEFVCDWCGKINEAAGGKVFICKIDTPPHDYPDSDYSLIIVDCKTLKKVQSISEYNQKYIEAYPNKDLYDPLAEFFSGYTPQKSEKLIEIAELISGGDKEVTEAVRAAVNNPKRYFNRNSVSYHYTFSIFTDDLEERDQYSDQNIDPEKVVFIGMINELFQRRYAYWVHYNSRLDHFLEDLERLHTYDLIKDVIPKIKFSKNGDIKSWCSAINAKLGGKARLCVIDPDVAVSDYVFPVVIEDAHTFEKIKELMPNIFWDI